MSRSSWDGVLTWLAPILAESEDRVLVIGPIAHRADCGWYFTLVSCRRGRGMSIDEMQCEDRSTMDKARTALIAELYHGPPRIVHIMDDELDQARICELLWPSRQATELRIAVERERRSSLH